MEIGVRFDFDRYDRHPTLDFTGLRSFEVLRWEQI